MNRKRNAVELFESGYNCAQSVIGAYCDLFGIEFETAMRVSEGFGGGMGRMRLTCGAVSGMFMLAGLAKSQAAAGDLDTRAEIYEAVRQMAKEFENLNGTIICAELLGKGKPTDNSSTPTARTKEFYQKRPCSGCIEDCASIVEKYLLN